MQGLNLAEIGHFVNVLPPIDITGGKVGTRFNMRGHKHATIIIQGGVSAAAWTKVIIRACSASTAGTVVDIPYRVYVEETDAGDTLAPVEYVAATGRTPTANNNVVYVIELDARELPDGKPWVEVALTNTANSVIASCVVFLSGARHAPNLAGSVLT